MLKKTILALIGLSASNLAISGTMGPICTPGAVTVPCEAKRWSLGIDALYLKLNNGTTRGYESSEPFRVLNTDSSWGFQIKGSYLFNTGNDISVSWLHVSDDVHQDIPSLDPFAPIENLINQSRFDQVNATLGQYVNLSSVNKMRLYAGLSYSDIQNNQTFYNLVFAQTGFSHSIDNSDFNGVGPVIGIDYSYDLINQLSLVVNSATSLYYGTTRVSYWIVQDATSLIFVPKYASKKTMVPGFEAKLGLNYTYNMPNGSLNIEGGYQVIQYLSPLQAFRNNVVVASDFGVYGPYIGAKYTGNI